MTGYCQRLACGDLRATALTIQPVQGLAQRQIRLVGVPSSGNPRGNRLATADLHPEALETERARPLGRRLVDTLETITRFPFPAGGAELAAGDGDCGSGRREAARCGKLTVERQLLCHDASLRAGCDRLGPMAVKRGKGERRGEGDAAAPAAVEDLFKLPLDQFTSARNALAAFLKKAGKTEEAAAVKALAKPPISAWAVNQLFWRHRKEFDRLLASGEKFRNAQAAQLSGKAADLRGTLEERRQALANLSKRAAELLPAAGHTPGPDTMRRLTTTLEALATYGSIADAPRPGFLTGDVDPPGFEALAALVPRSGSAASAGGEPRLLTFTQRTKAQTPKPKKETPEEKLAREEAERRARKEAATAAVQTAQEALREAKATAQEAEAALKKAAAASKDAEKERAAIEKQYEKASATADAAKQEARRVAEEAEAAAQAVEDAERDLDKAKKLLADAHLT